MSLKVAFICSLVLTLSNQLPIAIKNAELTNIVPKLIENVTISEESENVTVSGKSSDRTLVRTVVRPGMIVDNYALELEPNENSGTYSGNVAIRVNINEANTREDDIIFHATDIQVTSVEFAVGGLNNFVEAAYHQNDDGLLTISTGQTATLYRFVIRFEGNLNPGVGFYSGSFANGNSYLAMNLHPTSARHAFPCIDELTAPATMSLSVNGHNYPSIISNSMLEENSQTNFRPLPGPIHLWGLMAHSFATLNNPVANLVTLQARTGITNQERPASQAIHSYYNFLNEWTEKNFNEIVTNQNEMMHVIAVPDISMDWYSLSIVGVWEPYILMRPEHGVMQRKIAYVTIAEAMARQWFGFSIYPENWVHNWVLTGLATYTAYEAVKDLETNPNGEDDSLMDVDALFLTDVIQQSLLYDSYSSAAIQELQPETTVIRGAPDDERDIRQIIYGLAKYKAPAIMSLLRLTLGTAERDFIKTAARGLFVTRLMDNINDRHFTDNLGTAYESALPAAERLIGDVEDFVTPYITRTGYPLVRVLSTQGGVTLTQQHFGFTSPTPQETFEIPISFTRSIEPDFENIYPFMILSVGSFTHNIDIGGEDDWVIYNIQGRGYYRVGYDNELMERLTNALDDPDRREEIHPLNRATLVDDSLNIARGGLMSYDVALPLVLTMQHETEYAPWKAFIRNMDFIRKRLVALVDDDEDLDPDIYLRVVRRTIGAVENELGFGPPLEQNEPAMTSLTRGIVMDHACRSGYDPCIAAAIDWFYAPNTDEPTVNPDIPYDIRPAVFCTMVREGGEDVINALQNRLEIEPVMYERVVILESLGCSQDGNYINALLLQTIADDSPYTVEERVKIYKAIAGASHNNARLAFQFLENRVGAVRTRYGGDAKLEEVILTLAENMVDGDLSDMFERWVERSNNGLGDSEDFAIRALSMVEQDLLWLNRDLGNVYDWIDENDATTAALSMILVCFTLALTMFNH